MLKNMVKYVKNGKGTYAILMVMQRYVTLQAIVCWCQQRQLLPKINHTEFLLGFTVTMN